MSIRSFGELGVCLSSDIFDYPIFITLYKGKQFRSECTVFPTFMQVSAFDSMDFHAYIPTTKARKVPNCTFNQNYNSTSVWRLALLRPLNLFSNMLQNAWFYTTNQPHLQGSIIFVNLSRGTASHIDTLAPLLTQKKSEIKRKGGGRTVSTPQASAPPKASKTHHHSVCGLREARECCRSGGRPDRRVCPGRGRRSGRDTR